MGEHAPEWSLHKQPRDLMGGDHYEYSIWLGDEIVLMVDLAPGQLEHRLAMVVDACNNHTRLTRENETMRKALMNVREIIAAAAMTGFNYKDGDWAYRLFESQQVTSAALTSLKENGK